MSEFENNQQAKKRKLPRWAVFASIAGVLISFFYFVTDMQRADRSAETRALLAGELTQGEQLDLLFERCGNVLTGTSSSDATVKQICDQQIAFLADYIQTQGRSAVSNDYSEGFADALFERLSAPPAPSE